MSTSIIFTMGIKTRIMDSLQSEPTNPILLELKLIFGENSREIWLSIRGDSSSHFRFRSCRVFWVF